jgi:hypothetical protein
MKESGILVNKFSREKLTHGVPKLSRPNLLFSCPVPGVGMPPSCTKIFPWAMSELMKGDFWCGQETQFTRMWYRFPHKHIGLCQCQVPWCKPRRQSFSVIWVTSLLTIQGCCQSMAYNLLLDWSTHLRVCRIRQIIDVIC